MATTYKSFLSNDITNTRTLLHEAIPITGSIVSGTYNNANALALGSEANIKTYGHGMFESVYDYPFLSSSANHIFDITCGYASTSVLSSSANTQNSKKINIYNQMAQYLVGYDHTGSIKKFTLPSTGAEIKECYFVPFSRLLTKDEVKKGSFTMELGTKSTFDSVGTLFSSRIKLTDSSGSTGYSVDSPAGEYGELFPSSSAGQFHATAIDCIDTTGYVSSNADAKFTILIPTTAGGLGGNAVIIHLDADQNGGHSSAGDTIAVGTFDGSETDALAASYIIDALNGVPTATNARVVYASSGNGEAADDLAISAAQGSSDTQITITIDKIGTTGNLTNAITTTAGLDIVDVRSFTGAVDPIISGETLGDADTLPACGLLYYQAGIAVVSGSVFSDVADGGLLDDDAGTTNFSLTTSTTGFNSVTGSTISATADAIRTRMYNTSYNNTTELNSTIYFCRVNHNDFNYSSNPTYLSGSKLRVKTRAADAPVTYITTIGLYSADNELLAVAKLSEPLRKDPTNELTLRVRLDY